MPDSVGDDNDSVADDKDPFDAQLLQRAFRRDGRRNRRRKRIRKTKTVSRQFAIPIVFVVVVIAVAGWQLRPSAKPSPVIPTITDVNKIRIVEAVPSDKAQEPSRAKEIRAKIGAMQLWFSNETAGKVLRLAAGSSKSVKVERIVLSVATSSLLNQPNLALDLQQALFQSGFVLAPDEAAIVFTQIQPSEPICGQSAGRIAAVFPTACSQTSNEFSSNAALIAAHEMLHVLGAVEGCAPHAGRNGHVTDNPSDIMYEPLNASSPRRAAVQHLDPGHDDYYGTGRSNCIDVKRLPVWVNA